MSHDFLPVGDEGAHVHVLSQAVVEVRVVQYGGNGGDNITSNDVVEGDVKAEAKDDDQITVEVEASVGQAAQLGVDDLDQAALGQYGRYLDRAVLANFKYSKDFTMESGGHCGGRSRMTKAGVSKGFDEDKGELHRTFEYL